MPSRSRAGGALTATVHAPGDPTAGQGAAENVGRDQEVEDHQPGVGVVPVRQAADVVAEYGVFATGPAGIKQHAQRHAHGPAEVGSRKLDLQAHAAHRPTFFSSTSSLVCPTSEMRALRAAAV